MRFTAPWLPATADGESDLSVQPQDLCMLEALFSKAAWLPSKGLRGQGERELALCWARPMPPVATARTGKGQEGISFRLVQQVDRGFCLPVPELRLIGKVQGFHLAHPPANSASDPARAV